jgi:CubicO group peptidase (beta-lactamase class C family)
VQSTAVCAYSPTEGLRSTAPEQQGIDSQKLAEALESIRQRNINIHSLLIVRNGFVVLDAYFYPYDERDLHDIASVTKSLTSALVGIAIGQGKIKGVTQPLLQLFPARSIANREPRKERLTLEHLLSMTSGLDCKYEPGELTLRQMRESQDWTQFMLDLPMAAEPGSKFVYCSGGMHLLSAIISRTTGKNELEFARQTLFNPLGITEVLWPSDQQGVSHGWGDLRMHPRDMAKLGLLWLNRGVWEGKSIVPASWVDESTRVHAKTSDIDYGYGWWVKTRDIPFAYEAVGRGGQRINVVPSKNLVVVITGGGFDAKEVRPLLLPALKSDQALPENRAGVARLAAALTAVTKPPASNAAPPLPATARTISARSYLMETNTVGLKKLSLTFASQNEAALGLTFMDNHTEARPVGLDGVPRISANGRYGLPTAVKGWWEGPQTFVLDYDEIGNINHYQIRLKFNEAHIWVEVTERTHDVEAKFAGKLESD